MSAFDSNDMAQALPGANEAQARGWTRPKPYDYQAASQLDTGPSPVNGETHTSDWAHNARKYEWKDEFGDVGPEIPELEAQLYANETITRAGNYFDNMLTVKVIAEAQEKPAPIRAFNFAGLHPVVESNIEKCGYGIPTPIQAYTIPAVLKGHDIIATAQTGSGKTAAFLIPTISKLMGKAKKLAAPRPFVSDGEPYQPVRAEPLILVVAPTRELCCQIFDEARRLCYRSMLRPCLVYGGAPAREQRRELGLGCDILIATPGRLLDFMNDPHTLSLSRLRYTIIDEADEMLHEDWEENMTTIMSGADANQDATHQYLLFSATFDKNMRKVARKFLANDHVRVRIGRSGAIINNVRQNIVYVERNQKQKALYDLLIDLPPTRTMVFVRSKKTADFVDDYLFNTGLPSTSIHSDRTQREREDSIRAFREGSAPILVTTGVAARGLDVRNVMHVINFDLPSIDHNGEDEYVHRVGRTARIGNEGLATSFYNDSDEAMAMFLTKTLVECGQVVPDFLESFRPEGGVEWNDNSGEEDDDEDAENAPMNGDSAAAPAVAGWSAEQPGLTGREAPGDAWNAPADTSDGW